MNDCECIGDPIELGHAPYCPARVAAPVRIRRELGSETVRELVAAARERAAELPARTVRDPWPPSERVISATVEDEPEDICLDCGAPGFHQCPIG